MLKQKLPALHTIYVWASHSLSSGPASAAAGPPSWLAVAVGVVLVLLLSDVVTLAGVVLALSGVAVVGVEALPVSVGGVMLKLDGSSGSGDGGGLEGGFGSVSEFPLPPNPLPPAIGDQAGSSPGTQSEISGLVSASLFGLYAPFGYVGQPLAAYAFWLFVYWIVAASWAHKRLLGRAGLVNQLLGVWYAGCARPYPLKGARSVNCLLARKSIIAQGRD